MSKRRKLSGQFKDEVALALLIGERTSVELCRPGG
jgi:hypothetical protein